MLRRWNPDPDRLWAYRRRPVGKRVDPKDSRFVIARDNAREFREKFDRPQLVFKKTLGWGGYGVAMKYEQLDANHQHVADIAVKMPVSDDESKIRGFKREMKYYMTFEVSEHIPRLLHFPPAMTEIQEDGTQTLPVGNDQFWEEDSNLFPLVHYAMIVEYLEYDDMLELIYKLEEIYRKNGAAEGLHEIIPNRILWRFFLCLTRSCIAIAHPRKTEDEVQAIIAAQRNKTGSRPASTETPWHEEMSDSGEESYLVHKDLDPGNIFIGIPSPGNAEHQFHPIAKIADFGLMEYATFENQDRMRRGGKETWIAPEQFSDRMFTMLENNGGAFGSWTNIWGVGMIMFALMTRAMFTPDNRIRRWVSTPTPDEPGLRTETYGYHLDETWDSGRFGPRSPQSAGLVTDYDKELRVLVMRCMAYDAFERPVLEELLDAIEAAISKGDEKEASGDVGVKETNAQLEAFYDYYFHSAPEKPDPWEGNY